MKGQGAASVAIRTEDVANYVGTCTEGGRFVPSTGGAIIEPL